VRIYDPLGNVVFDQTLNNVKEVKVDWEGRNIQGRFVGSGTYLAIVEATDLKTGKKMKPSRHPIGIKR
ncbi:MAG TPA: hypothetical protein VKY57_00460, partial [Chitinispirillaceae bacterium]|nr:hypothetical protein [Chitinispirillaceae bacterium]